MKFYINEPENDEGVIWKKKKDADRFLAARRGDLISFPFQCDFCWAVNITGKEASAYNQRHKVLMSYIRRVNLDMMWSKEPSTVSSTLNNLVKARKNCARLGLDPLVIPQGPWEVKDNAGMQIAIEILIQSQGKGKNATGYQQFDSIRKIRSSYANAMRGSAIGAIDTKLKTNRGVSFGFVAGPTESVLFEMFMLGLRKRMGKVTCQNLGLSYEVLSKLLELYDEELASEDIKRERFREIIVFGAAFVTLYAGALRGNEVFFMERSEFVRKRNLGVNMDKSKEHIVVPLMGRFKGELGERNLMLVFARTSRSGLSIGRWISQLSDILLQEKKHIGMGPALCHEDGTPYDSTELNAELESMLLEIQSDSPELIDPKVDVRSKFSINRSFRRGATTRVKENGIDSQSLDMNNRWRKLQNAGGSLSTLTMADLYTEISQTLISRLKFSRHI